MVVWFLVCYPHLILRHCHYVIMFCACAQCHLVDICHVCKQDVLRTPFGIQDFCCYLFLWSSLPQFDPSSSIGCDGPSYSQCSVQDRQQSRDGHWTWIWIYRKAILQNKYHPWTATKNYRVTDLNWQLPQWEGQKNSLIKSIYISVPVESEPCEITDRHSLVRWWAPWIIEKAILSYS